MPQENDTLYPINFTEEMPAAVVVVGRDIEEARRLVRLAVVDVRLTYAQIVPLLIGRPTGPDGVMLEVGVTDIGVIRQALMGTTDGITASVDTASLRFREAMAVCDDVAKEREETWTFLGEGQEAMGGRG